jgi:hypothetical protein
MINCSDPIDSAVLADYWLALLATPQEESVEEHLLACDPCGERLREIIALGDGVGQLAREACLRMIVSDTYLKRAAEKGLRVREYALPPGGSVQCTVTAEDDFLIGRLAANLSGAKQVDLSFCNESGIEEFRLPDIPVHPGGESVILHESCTIMKTAPSSTIIARLITYDDAGSERLLGEYTFNHTRTMPGPGVWPQF